MKPRIAIVHFRLAPPKSGVTFTMDLPKGAKPLRVLSDSVREIRLYARCDVEQPYVTHTFLAVPTGYPIEDPGAEYVDSVRIPGPPELGGAGDIVLHILHKGVIVEGVPTP